MKFTPSVLVTSAAMIIGISVGAQTRPDFSGTWVITSAQSGAPTTLVVKQDATSVTESDGLGADAHTVVAKLDGTPTRTTLPVHGTEEIVVVSTAAFATTRSCSRALPPIRTATNETWCGRGRWMQRTSCTSTSA